MHTWIPSAPRFREPTGNPHLRLLRSRIPALLILLMLSLLGQLHGQFQNLSFRRLSVEQGLPRAAVYCMAQDSMGFLWFGTPAGLSRYDGYTFKLYDSSPLYAFSTIHADSHGSLWFTPSGEIHRLDLATETITRYRVGSRISAQQVVEDRDGTIWVTTKGDGLAKYVPSADSFLAYTHNPRDRNSLCNDTVWTINEDRKGRLWIGTGRGMDRLEKESGRFVHYDSVSMNPVWDIIEDEEQSIWLGTSDGLCKLDPVTGQLERYKSNDLPHNASHWLYLSHDNHLWMQSGGRIARFNRSAKRFEFVQGADPKTAIGVGGYLYRPFFEDRHGRLWVSTLAGLALFDRTNEVLSVVKTRPGDPNSMAEGYLDAFMEDNSGNVWIATGTGGVCMLDNITPPFVHIAQHPYDKIQLSHGLVSAILEDSAGILWVGSHHGLDRLEPTTGHKKHSELSLLGGPSLTGSSIHQILEDGPDILWIATSEGLGMLNRRTGRSTTFAPRASEAGIAASRYTMSLCIDRAGTLWVGGGVASGLLMKFDRTSRRFTNYYFPDVKETEGERAVPVKQIYEGRSGILWFTSSSGSHFDRNTGQFRHMSQDTTVLSYTCFCEDAAGNVWAGSERGLARLNKGAGTFSLIPSNDDLADANVLAILEENSSPSEDGGKPRNLWLLTGNGISRFNPVTGAVRNYGPAERVPIAASEFVCASFKSPQGYLYFGGTNGFVKFHPDSIRENPFIPPIVLTSFRKFDKPCPIPSEIQLPYDENFISFEFAALSFVNPERNQYAYKLDGVDREWVYAGTRRYASYPNLAPGDYVFRVKGSNNDGLWNEAGTSISILITPPWWKTIWAYLFYGLVLAGIGYYLWRMQVSRLQKQHEYEMARFEAAKLHEMDEMKSRFFANISHEFRTPLTLILGPASEVMEESDREGTRQKLNVVQKNARRLLALVNQLLDLSKLESGNMKLQAAPLDVVSLMKGISQSFCSYAERKRISFSVGSSEQRIMVYIDRDKFEKILTNVLSNAIKFTPEGGAVDVTAKLISGPSEGRTGGEFVEICVSDTGIGIPADKLSRIFDRFYQVDDSRTRVQGGTGIGLSLTKELIELHKGTIRVESQEGRGTTVSIKFPLGTRHLLPGEICSAMSESESLPNPPAFIPQSDEEKNGRPLGPRTPEMGKEVVLVVEDNADVRDYVRRNLLPSYRVVEAADGEEGWKKALEELPDVIVSDVMMPRMDGFELCRRLKQDERTSHIPVLLLTAKASSRDKIEGLDIGADDYILKPFEPEEVKARIRNLIEQRRKIHEHFRKHGLLEIEQKQITPVDQKFLQNALAVIAKHMSDPAFGVELMAEEMTVSRSLLLKKCEALTGEPPSELIKRTRLNRAAQLIAGRFGNVTEIALEVGFNNPSYFTECFRKQFGCPPSHYRHRADSKNA